jgi:hypothetical protein
MDTRLSGIETDRFRRLLALKYEEWLRRVRRANGAPVIMVRLEHLIEKREDDDWALGSSVST